MSEPIVEGHAPERAALYTSNRSTWCTPEVVLERVRRLAPIGLDPCGSRESIVNAATTYYEADDGLTRDWSGRGLVFVNPPYGRGIGAWLAKCARIEGDVVALVPARTDTAWWHNSVVCRASAICFWRGRLTFLGAKAGAPFPSAIVYWGDCPQAFAEAFGDVGHTLVLR